MLTLAAYQDLLFARSFDRVCVSIEEMNERPKLGSRKQPAKVAFWV